MESDTPQVSAIADTLNPITGAAGAAVQAFANGFPVFALHVGMTLLILVLATMIYGHVTPHRELKLIRAGNTAAAISFGGAIIGLSIPLAVSMSFSLNWADLVLWGVVTVLVQLLVFRVVQLFLNRLPKRIADGDTAAATMLVAVKLGVSVILAAGVAGAPLARL